MNVTLKYDSQWRALEWAKVHCNSFTSIDYISCRDNRIIYRFGESADATYFLLKWGGINEEAKD